MFIFRSVMLAVSLPVILSMAACAPGYNGYGYNGYGYNGYAYNAVVAAPAVTYVQTVPTVVAAPTVAVYSAPQVTTTQMVPVMVTGRPAIWP